MLARRAFACALVAPLCLAIRSTITVEDGCPSGDGAGDPCVLTNRVFDFPQYARGDVGEHFDFTVKGTSLGAFGHGWRYRASATILGVQAWNSSGVACSDTVFGDSVAFRAEVGLPACGAPAGPVTIPGNVRITIPALPYPARIHFRFDVDDGQGRPAVRLTLIFKPALEAGAAIAPAVAPRRPRLAAPALSAITATDCCAPGVCALQRVALDFPPSLHMGDMKFTVSGTAPGAGVGELRYGLKATMHAVGVVPVTVLLGNGSACGPTTSGDHVEFNMQLPFQSCPVAGGAAYALHGHVRFTAPLDALGRLEIVVDTSDGAGRPVTCTHVAVRFLGPAPQPAPPAPAPVPPPAPSGPLYRCSSTELCIEAAAGVGLAQCEAMCKPAPAPPAEAKYACDDGVCVANPAGLDIAVCQAAC